MIQALTCDMVNDVRTSWEAHLALLLLASGCGFEPSNTAQIDAPPVDTTDAPPDVPAGPARSCKDVHAAMPAAPSGLYMIDPDGEGGSAAISVSCDMTTQGGGWTLIFVPAQANLQASNLTYTVQSAPLMIAATDTLIAYRDQQAVVGDFATFALPSAWRTASPMAMSQADENVMVSVDGEAPAMQVLRYGYNGFTTNCLDFWTSSPWGRVCIVGTRAPFFNGFADPTSDGCGDSTSAYNSTPCASTRLFTIAVR